MTRQEPGVLTFRVPAVRHPFGLAFLLFSGLSFVLFFFLARELLGELRAKSWPEVSCTILRSKIYYPGARRTPFPDILYHYEVNGKHYESAQIRPATSPSPRGYIAVSQFIAAYPTGSQTRCRVNPAAATQSVLQVKPCYWLPALSLGPILIWLVIYWVGVVDWFRGRNTLIRPGLRKRDGTIPAEQP